MFQIVFVPKSQHAERIKSLGKDKLDLLQFVLFNAVSKYFSAKARGYNTQLTSNGAVTIAVIGVMPFSDGSSQELVQQISNELSETRLGDLYQIAQTNVRAEAHDILLAPDAIKSYHTPESLISAFDLNERAVPVEFVCPITKSIMHNPAYLTTNPKINYEYTDLMKWIITNNTDPSTRVKISTPGVICNNELRKKINSFVMDMILGKPVHHYFESEKKDVAVQCSLSSNISALFATTKLSNEIHAVAAKALRRAVSENLPVSDVKSLLDEYGAENIMDLQDDNPQSGKTALHIAVLRNNTAAVQLLLGLGAKLDIKDSNGETAKSLAEKSKNDQVKELVRKQETKNPSPR